ncbi:MAG: hypothetical protein ACJ8AD_11150 [Gemmatimonadaceae bacterium]
MRHLARPLAVLFALWFAIVLGDPGMLHTCAMHGGHGGHGAAAAAPTPSHDGHGMHGASGNAHQSAPADTHRPDSAPACTCIGHCCAVTVAAPLPAVATVPVPVAVAEERHPLDAPPVQAPAAPDRRLPFSNGPPTV